MGGLYRAGRAYSLTTVVKRVLFSTGESPVGVEESLADHGSEGDVVRHRFGVAALIDLVGDRALGERWVIGQVSSAVEGVGGGNVIRVAV